VRPASAPEKAVANAPHAVDAFAPVCVKTLVWAPQAQSPAARSSAIPTRTLRIFRFSSLLKRRMKFIPRPVAAAPTRAALSAFCLQLQRDCLGLGFCKQREQSVPQVSVRKAQALSPRRSSHRRSFREKAGLGDVGCREPGLRHQDPALGHRQGRYRSEMVPLAERSGPHAHPLDRAEGFSCS
jgi:hypothetical protein